MTWDHDCWSYNKWWSIYFSHPSRVIISLLFEHANALVEWECICLCSFLLYASHRHNVYSRIPGIPWLLGNNLGVRCKSDSKGNDWIANSLYQKTNRISATRILLDNQCLWSIMLVFKSERAIFFMLTCFFMVLLCWLTFDIFPDNSVHVKYKIFLSAMEYLPFSSGDDLKGSFEEIIER